MEENGIMKEVEMFVNATIQADLIFLDSSESSLLFWHNRQPEKNIINKLSKMLSNIVGGSSRAYLGPEKLLILLEGFADVHVKHHFRILIQTLEQTRSKSVVARGRTVGDI